MFSPPLSFLLVVSSQMTRHSQPFQYFRVYMPPCNGHRLVRPLYICSGMFAMTEVRLDSYMSMHARNRFDGGPEPRALGCCHQTH
mmetsp:Transcript_19485/g.29406  ORF Transcript_19485/g.29406 Transcript_19485/m.29406 type:complete len:85 (-) Transcript_19485:930-1184(-)